jgi:hypothetical protein
MDIRSKRIRWKNIFTPSNWQSHDSSVGTATVCGLEVVSFKARRLCSRSPLDRKLGGTHSRSGQLWSREKNSCFCHESNPDRPTSSPPLYRLNYYGSSIIHVFLSSSLLPHLGACSRFWSIGLSFLGFLIRDSP